MIYLAVQVAAVVLLLTGTLSPLTFFVCELVGTALLAVVVFWDGIAGFLDGV